MFHRHKWEDVSCTYTPGLVNMNGDVECSEVLIERMMFGITNIIQRCTKCKKISSHQFIGKGTL